MFTPSVLFLEATCSVRIIFEARDKLRSAQVSNFGWGQDLLSAFLFDIIIILNKAAAIAILANSGNPGKEANYVRLRQVSCAVWLQSVLDLIISSARARRDDSSTFYLLKTNRMFYSTINNFRLSSGGRDFAWKICAYGIRGNFGSRITELLDLLTGKVY